MKTKFLQLFASIVCGLAFTNPAPAQIWHTYTNTSGLPDTNVITIAFQADSVVWFAMFKFGVVRYNGSSWKMYNTENVPELGSADIVALAYSNNELWVGSDYGVAKFDGTSWYRLDPTNSGLSSTSINSLCADRNNNIWIGTDTYLNEFKSDGTWRLFSDTTIPAIEHSAVDKAIMDNNGRVWIAFGSGSGMARFNGVDSIGDYYWDSNLPDFPDDFVMAIAVDNNGDAWCPLFYSGLIKVNGVTNAATVYSRNTVPSFIGDSGTAATIDQCGNVWIGTQTGAAMFDGATWTNYRGGYLPSNYINDITVDPQGHIWFATQNGAAEYMPLPQRPWLASPTNDMTITTDSIICSWAWDCPNIQKYWYEIADNPNFNNSIIDTTTSSLINSANVMERKLKDKGTYYWRVKAKNDVGWGPMSQTWRFTVNLPTAVNEHNVFLRSEELLQNYPNPFLGNTTIQFTLPNAERTRVDVFDIHGMRIASFTNGIMQAGLNTVYFDGGNLPAGVYQYRVVAQTGVLTGLMSLVK